MASACAASTGPGTWPSRADMVCRPPRASTMRHTGCGSAPPCISSTMRLGGLARASGGKASSAAAGDTVACAKRSGPNPASRSASVRLGYPTYIITTPETNHMTNSRQPPMPSHRWVQ
ncbi:hypothetical protein [Variovorax sp. E3]|uniref:hypothetical protein n=1 Tax=Variovorax sp. E3 TaxID=1914993 RepID=UPI0022B62EB3|nr:hypothetical protein [Variovorax sp. E3]